MELDGFEDYLRSVNSALSTDPGDVTFSTDAGAFDPATVGTGPHSILPPSLKQRRAPHPSLQLSAKPKGKHVVMDNGLDGLTDFHQSANNLNHPEGFPYSASSSDLHSSSSENHSDHSDYSDIEDDDDDDDDDMSFRSFPASINGGNSTTSLTLPPPYKTLAKPLERARPSLLNLSFKKMVVS
jgi:hypothetical protein